MELTILFSHPLLLYSNPLKDDLADLSTPIYLYGPKGSGKSHLLAAAAQQLQAQGSGLNTKVEEHFLSMLSKYIDLNHSINYALPIVTLTILSSMIFMTLQIKTTQEEFSILSILYMNAISLSLQVALICPQTPEYTE